MASIFDVPDALSQALIAAEWVSASGCLAVTVFDPDVADGDRLYVLDEMGHMKAELSPRTARGFVVDPGGNGWLILDRTTRFDTPEAELFDINDPAFHLTVAADEPFPDLVGVDIEPGLTVAEAVRRLRAR